MPTLIGWAGASGSISWNAWFLFGLLFLWQFPHFLAIALMYREDYARAGYRMLPDFDRDSRFTRAEILGFTVILVLATMLPAVSRTVPIYLAVMGVSGAYFLYHVARLMRSTSRVFASRVVHASVLYLPIVLAMMIAYKR
jgi:protoheme IX farnesyltransferase